MSWAANIALFLYYLPSLLWYGAIGLVVTWLYRSRKQLPDNVPPFPIKPYPIVGHLPMMKSKNPCDLFAEWRKKVGDVFTLYVGSQLVVVMNSWEPMKEALIKNGEYFSDRPTYGALSQNDLENGGLIGIFGNNGANWKEQRSVSMQILRQFGMGKNWLAEKIQEEVSNYIEQLANHKGEPQDVQLLTNASVANVICAILIGNRFELDDPNFIKLIKLLNEQVVILARSRAVSAFPFLKHVPGDFFGAKSIVQYEEDFAEIFGTKFIEEIKKSNDMNNFIGSYLSEMERRKKAGMNTALDERNLTRTMSNLFSAGSETTSTTIMWSLMFAIYNPHAQEKFYQEIAEVCGTERPPNINDKPKLSYSTAYIMETLRLGSIAPLSLQHYCTKTTDICGYTIPANSVIIPNLNEVLKDEKIWGDSKVFRPERFLDKDNEVLVPEQFCPFSIGRRYCMGESMARMELFLFITSIFQRFQILPEDPDNLPPLVPIFGITSAPMAFKVRLVER